MKYFTIMVFCIALIVNAGTALAGTTVIEFDGLPGGDNTPIPGNYASSVSSSTAGISVTGGGTPDIILDWFALDDGWVRQSSSNWAALDTGSVNVAHMKWNDLMIIGFITNNDATFTLGQFELGNSTDQIAQDFGWDIILSRTDDGPAVPVATRNSADLGPGETTSVVFDFTGEPGADYELEFFPNDNAIGQPITLTALDGLSFSQDVTDSPLGDFNSDTFWDCLDIDALVGAVAQSSTDLTFDMNGDGNVTLADITESDSGWLAVGGAMNAAATGGNPFLVGDYNLDGFVDGNDFLRWNSNKFTNVAEWCAGDANADGAVSGEDFLAWNSNKFTASDVVAVPEPCCALVLMGLLWWRINQ